MDKLDTNKTYGKISLSFPPKQLDNFPTPEPEKEDQVLNAYLAFCRLESFWVLPQHRLYYTAPDYYGNRLSVICETLHALGLRVRLEAQDEGKDMENLRVGIAAGKGLWLPMQTGSARRVWNLWDSAVQLWATHGGEVEHAVQVPNESVWTMKQAYNAIGDMAMRKHAIDVYMSAVEEPDGKQVH